jgi:hypothetical protein
MSMSARFRFILDPVETAIRRFFKAFGYEILKMGREYSPDELAVFTKVRPYTGTSIERVVGPDERGEVPDEKSDRRRLRRMRRLARRQHDGRNAHVAGAG